MHAIDHIRRLSALGATWVVAASAGLASASVMAAGSPWLQPGGDAQNTWFNARETVIGVSDLTQLRQVWFDTDFADGYTSAVVADQKVYVNGGPSNPDGRRLRRLDAATGQVEWEVFADTFLLIRALVLTDQLVIATGGTVMAQGQRKLQVVAFQRDTGAQVWSTLLDATDIDEAGSNLLKTDGQTVYISADPIRSPARIWALNATTGAVRWESLYPYTGSNFYTLGMAVDAGRLVMSHWFGVTAWDAKTGAQQWDQPGKHQLRRGPLVVGDSVFVMSGAGQVESLKARNGKRRWRVQAPCQQPVDTCSNLALASDGRRIYTSTMSKVSDGNVYFKRQMGALDVSTGQVVWSAYQGPEYSDTNLALANGVLFFVDTQLKAVDTRNGAFLPIADFPANPGGELVIGDGRLYFGDGTKGLRMIMP